MAKNACTTCRSQLDMDDAEKCNNCWEVERRLLTYLRTGGFKAREFIAEAILAMSPSVGPGDQLAPPGPIHLTVEQGGTKIGTFVLSEVVSDESWDRDRPDGGLVLIAGRMR